MNIAPINFNNIAEEEKKDENYLPPSGSSHAAMTGWQMPGSGCQMPG